MLAFKKNIFRKKIMPNKTVSFKRDCVLYHCFSRGMKEHNTCKSSAVRVGTAPSTVRRPEGAPPPNQSAQAGNYSNSSSDFQLESGQKTAHICNKLKTYQQVSSLRLKQRIFKQYQYTKVIKFFLLHFFLLYLLFNHLHFASGSNHQPCN